VIVKKTLIITERNDRLRVKLTCAQHVSPPSKGGELRAFQVFDAERNQPLFLLWPHLLRGGKEYALRFMDTKSCSWALSHERVQGCVTLVSERWVEF